MTAPAWSVDDRFWSKVAIRAWNDCWNWRGSFFRSGYGQFWFEGTNHHAHRVSFVLGRGEIAGDLQVLHRCDNKACVNPSHLFLGTHDDNMADKCRKGRQARGEGNGRSKLTASDIREIRALWSNGFTNKSRLSARFQVSRAVIADIVSGEKWSHVQ